jgi:hypothetical protein
LFPVGELADTYTISWLNMPQRLTLQRGL